MTNNATLSAEAATSDADPTTVVITRFVKPGREEDYKRWLARLIAAAEDAPNSLRTVVLAPQPGDSNTFRLIHRFADAGSLHAWDDSDARRRLSAEADQFSTSQRQVATGLETFSVPEAPALPPPPKWKMAIVTFVVAYALTAIIIPREMAWLPSSWSFYLVNVITNVLLVGLLTYAAMPIAARTLRRWLY